MKRLTMQPKHILTLLFAGMLAAGPALADKPSWAGKPSHEDRETQDRGISVTIGTGTRFDDRQRAAIRDYYYGQSRAGKCPPGLAKKRNGCLPPGQAKKWAVGQPLSGDAVIYDLPSSVTVKLGTPPAGHRYVRVAADILLIAVGTGMVVDAIEDIGRK